MLSTVCDMKVVVVVVHEGVAIVVVVHTQELEDSLADPDRPTKEDNDVNGYTTIIAKNLSKALDRVGFTVRVVFKRPESGRFGRSRGSRRATTAFLHIGIFGVTRLVIVLATANHRGLSWRRRGRSSVFLNAMHYIESTEYVAQTE